MQTMDMNTFQFLLQDDQDLSHQSIHHTDYSNYALSEPAGFPALEPINNGTYMNLSTSPMQAAHEELYSSSFYYPQPSYNWTGPNSGLLQPLCKLEDPGYLASDEGFGSSASSFKSLSPPADPRTSPAQRSSECDFSEGPLPPMQLFRKQCVNCGTSQCPNDQWTVEASGHLLCLSCSAATSSAIPSLPQQEDQVARKRNRSTAASTRRAQISCINCTTTVTSLWRRNPKGEFVCNACGLYEKLHKRQRPISMRKDSIQKRKRRPRSESGKKKVPSNDAQARRQPMQNNILPAFLLSNPSKMYYQ